MFFQTLCSQSWNRRKGKADTGAQHRSRESNQEVLGRDTQCRNRILQHHQSPVRPQGSTYTAASCDSRGTWESITTPDTAPKERTKAAVTKAIYLSVSLFTWHERLQPRSGDWAARVWTTAWAISCLPSLNFNWVFFFWAVAELTMIPLLKIKKWILNNSVLLFFISHSTHKYFFSPKLRTLESRAIFSHDFFFFFFTVLASVCRRHACTVCSTGSRQIILF